MTANLTRRSALQWTGAAFALPQLVPNKVETGRMAFAPKFVDMVRNVTSVTGTGPVTLGPAVAGFTSLSGVAAAGEQFYYCIQGVDNPAEREIGRGTMQADGKIAREPVSGTPTNFSLGSKTIALVAAAEWFAKLDQLGIDAAAGIADRATLASRQAGPAMLKEAGREGLFLFDGSNLAGKVAADKAQGIYVAPTRDPTGANGAWVRKFSGPVDPRWFGLSTSNSGAQNDAALQAMFAALRARSPNIGYWSLAVEPILFPAGRYNFSSTIELTDGQWWIEGVSAYDDSGTLFKFPAGITGIRVQTEDTQGASGTRTAAKTGTRSTIKNLTLEGAYSGTDGEAHGIHLRAGARLSNCLINDFEGDGVRIEASATVDGGNANGFSLDRVRSVHNRCGFFIDGADANAGALFNCDGSSNRSWGFNDSSFLGNTYVACHAAANGWDGALGSIPTACTYNGNRYYVKVGQAAWCSTNAPSGTTADNQGWGYHSAGGTYNGVVAWISGTIFREGGAYKTDSANGRTIVVGCYSESDQNPSQLVTPTMVLGGTHGPGVKGTAGYLRTSVAAGVLEADAFRFGYNNGTSNFDSQIGEQGAQTALRIADSVAAPAAWRLKLSGNDLVFDYANGGTARAYVITGPSTAVQFGTGAAVPHAFFVPHLCIGDSGESPGNARRIAVDTAAPATGAHAQGEIVFNRTPAAGGKVGWICVTAGTPGVWKAFGAIDP